MNFLICLLTYQELNNAVNNESYLPKYLKIKNQIEEVINQGEIKPGDKLPTESELTGKYNVSRHTVRKALNILQQEGLLEKKQGVGTFVSESIKKESKNIGFVSISLQDYIFGDILNGVDEVFHERGYQILLGNSKDDQTREKEILKEFFKKNIDGLIIEPAKSAFNYSNLDLLERFLENQIPVVILDSKFENERFNYITVDDKKGGFMATNYLIEIGHKNVGIVYKELHKPAVGRFKGYKLALEQKGIPVFNNLVKGYYTSEIKSSEKFEEEVTSLIGELVENIPRPTAIFCSNDQVAILVKEILARLDIKVPGDISLIGFDDSKLVRLNNVSITSLTHPKRWAGKKAAEIILDNIKKDKTKYNENIIFTPRLIKRDSVASPS